MGYVKAVTVGVGFAWFSWGQLRQLSFFSLWMGGVRCVAIRLGSCGYGEESCVQFSWVSAVVVLLVRVGCVTAVGVSCDMLLWGAISSDKFGHVTAV